MRLKSEYFKMQLNIFESTEEGIYKDFMFTSLSTYLKLRRQTEKKIQGLRLWKIYWIIWKNY